MNDFVDGYNHHHRHTGIGLHTPADAHYGHAETRHAERQATLVQARARHPERFTTNRSPKIINLPGKAGINQPTQEKRRLATLDSRWPPTTLTNPPLASGSRWPSAARGSPAPTR